MTRTGSARDNSLTDKGFQRLLDACERSTRPLLDKFLVLVMGILGLRKGEVAHMKEGWVDFDKGVIQIPGHEPCNCSRCKNQAKQMTNHRDISFKEALKKYWRPKTEAAKRGIYFKNRHEVKEVIEKVMSKHGECPIGMNGINRRISKLAEMADLEDVYPHALRATAAMKYAYDRFNVFQLMAIMGWADMKAALKYIRASGAGAKKAMKETYPDNPEPAGLDGSPRVFGPTEFVRKLHEKALI